MAFVARHDPLLRYPGICDYFEFGRRSDKNLESINHLVNHGFGPGGTNHVVEDSIDRVMFAQTGRSSLVDRVRYTT